MELKSENEGKNNCTQNSESTHSRTYRINWEKKLTHAKIEPIHFGYSVLLFYLAYDKFGCAQLNDWWWHCFKFFIKSQNVKAHVIFCPFLFWNQCYRTLTHTHAQQTPLHCAKFRLLFSPSPRSLTISVYQNWIEKFKVMKLTKFKFPLF